MARKNSGFTIIELMIVIMIGFILCSLIYEPLMHAVTR